MTQVSDHMTKFTMDTALFAVSRLMISASNLILLPLLTKNLSASEYGIWSQVWITIPLITTIITLGLPNSMARFFPSKSKKEYSKHYQAILVIVIISALIISSTIFIIKEPLSSLLFGNNTLIATYLSLILFFWAIDYIYLHLLRAVCLLNQYGIIYFFQNCSEIGLAVILILSGWGVEGAILAILIVRSLLFLILLISTRNLVEYVHPQFDMLSSYLTYALPTVPLHLASWMLSSVDRYMIGIILSASEVGYYTSAYLVGQSIPFLVSSVMAFSLTPYLSSMYDMNNISDIKDTITFMTKVVLIVALPFIGFTIVMASPLLQLLTTQEIAINSSQLIPIVAGGLLFYGLKIIVSQDYLLKKRTVKLSFTYIIAALVNVFLNLLFIPYIGIMGAAFATLLAYFLDLLITVWWDRDGFIPIISLKDVCKIVVIAIITISPSIALFYVSISPMLLLSVVSCGFVYVASIYLIKPFAPKEVSLIKNTLKTYINKI